MHSKIKTSIGDIAINIKEVKDTIPVIFLHGVYFDHTLWKYQTDRITDRTVIAVDMPFHGQSKGISNKHWTLDDCATMLIELLDSLKIEKTIAIGHSWGSMTILRAANKAPGRFQSIGLCNMPYKAATTKVKLLFGMQHLFLGFRKFYTKQAAKALFGKDSYSKYPTLLNILDTSMRRLTNEELKHTDSSVIIEADNAEPLIRSLKVPAMALNGAEDYVGQPPHLMNDLVEGGHVSPVEVPQEVYNFVQKVIVLK